MQHRLEFAAFQLFKWAILSLPLKSAQRFGAYFGSLAFHLIPSRRRIALDNLRYAFPEMNEAARLAIVKGAFRNYGITLVELLWFPNLTDAILRKLVTVRNPEVIARGYSAGRGMVMLSGHFGNWELIALGVAHLTKIPFSIIVQTQANKLIDRVINRHRCLFGNSVIPMGMSVRGIIKTLSEGGVVAIAPDQSGPMEGVFVDFFGRSVATHQGPAAFALRSRAPLQMGFMIRKADGTYEVILEEVPTADLTEPTEENIIELTRRHTALLERYIRLYPDHWLWMHRRWKHTWESVHREQERVDDARA
jgi:Kdo2-lipid IVA lauroyltransferase/acyltransferase